MKRERKLLRKSAAGCGTMTANPAVRKENAMAKYVLAPDSFKGTLTSEEVSEILAEEIRRKKPDAAIVSLPVADGGEGTVDAFFAALSNTGRAPERIRRQVSPSFFS